MADPVEVLDYWIGAIGPKGWFAAGKDLDADISDRFGDLWQAAFNGGLEHWVDGPGATLAYIVLCDQLSRNMHRGRAQAFATDSQALAAARVALDAGWDLMAPEPERMFFYMPFEHSENPADQVLSVTLMTERLSDADLLLHATAHQDVITRFGRFPNRNAALGRANTPDEATFLAEGGYGWFVERLKASHASGA